MTAPDVGDIVLYHGDRYRVESWLKEISPDAEALTAILYPSSPEVDIHDVLRGVLYESQQEIRGKKLGWCRREEAEFVSIRGVGGGLAGINEVEVVGRVPWPEWQIEELRQRANQMADDHEVLF